MIRITESIESYTEKCLDGDGMCFTVKQYNHHRVGHPYEFVPNSKIINIFVHHESGSAWILYECMGFLYEAEIEYSENAHIKL